MSKVSLLIFLFLTLAGCSGENALDRGSVLSEYQERTVTVDGKEQKYRVFVPTGREEHSNAKLPVMLYLHGSGSRGDENREQAWAFDSAIGPQKSKVDFIVVLPQCRPDLAWVSDEMSNYALAALAESMKEFNADPERIYLAGFSLGAHGVWKIASENPGKFAALMPVAGRVIPYESKSASDSAYAEVAKATGFTPIWIFHGAKDDTVSVDFARKIVTALKESGNVNVRYTEYADEGHLIFGKAFAEPGLLEWLGNQSNHDIDAARQGSEVNRDFVDFSAAISGIIWDENSPFSSDSGDWLSIEALTVMPDTDFLLKERAIPDELRQRFILANKEPIHLRPSGYDVKFAHDIFEAKGLKSFERVFADRKRANARLRAIVRLSNVSRDSQTSLIYIEYYSPKKGLLKFYCVAYSANSKRTWLQVT